MITHSSFPCVINNPSDSSGLVNSKNHRDQQETISNVVDKVLEGVCVLPRDASQEQVWQMRGNLLLQQRMPERALEDA